MTFHVVLGAGVTASLTAGLLADRGDRVLQLSRSGRGHPRAERVAADATDPDAISRLADGAALLVNCAMPAYERWETDALPLATSVLTAAERTGAGYVLLGNLYGYGDPGTVLTPDTPLKADHGKGLVRRRMWEDALAAAEAGRVRATEVRAAAFLGPGVVSLWPLMVAPDVRAGEPVVFPGDLDAPRAWSFVEDVARTLVAAGADERSWGRAWHAPVSTASTRELTARFAELTGSPPPRLTAWTLADLTAAAATEPFYGTLIDRYPELSAPQLVDWSDTRDLLAVPLTPLDTALLTTTP